MLFLSEDDIGRLLTMDAAIEALDDVFRQLGTGAAQNIARGRAKLSTKEAANGVGLRKDLIEAVEAEEPVLEDEASRIKDLIAALGG